MLKQWAVALGLVLIAAAGLLAWQHWLPDTAGENRRERPPGRVNVVLPVVDTVVDTVSAVGSLNARETVALTTEVSGRVIGSNLNVGQRVEAGTVLLRLDDRQARADLQVAEATLEDARRQFDRARSLQSNNSISQSRVDELRTLLNVAEAQRIAARIRVENHRIVAPFAGVIGLNDVTTGAYLDENTEVATLDATEVMELNFAIPEKFMGAVTLGQPVTGRSPAYPQSRFSGQLVELGTRVNVLSRTLPVRALVDNADGRLRPGQFMSASLVLRQREALVIPEQAVITRGDETFVYVAIDGAAKRRSVLLGTRSPGLVEIVSGLSTDDRIIVTGQDRLSSGDRINVVEDPSAIPDNRFTMTQDS